MPSEAFTGGLLSGGGSSERPTISPSSSPFSHPSSTLQPRPPTPERSGSHRSAMSASTASSSSTGGASGESHRHGKLPKFLLRNKKDDGGAAGSRDGSGRGSKLPRRRKSDASALEKLPSTSEGAMEDFEDDAVSISPSVALVAHATLPSHRRRSTISYDEPEEEQEVLVSTMTQRGSVISLEDVPDPAPSRKASRAKTLRKKTSKLFSTGSSSSKDKGSSASSIANGTAYAPARDPSPSQSPVLEPPKPLSVRRSSSPSSSTSDPVVLVDAPLRGLASPTSSKRRPHQSSQSRSRPGSTASTDSNHQPSLAPQGGFYQHPAQQNSAVRIHDIASAIPNRLGGWLSNFLPANQQQPSGSSPPLSHATPIPLSLHAMSSPPRQPGQRSFVSAAREKGAIGRYFLDSDAKKPERNQESIWIMGRRHDGWRPDEVAEQPRAAEQHALSNLPQPPATQVHSPQRKSSTQTSSAHSSSSPGRFINLFSASSISLIGHAGGEESSPRREKGKKDDVRWPAEFYEDFRTSVWCTYRSQYAAFAALPQHLLAPPPSAYDADGLPTPAFLHATKEHVALEPPIPRVQSGWAWVKSGGGTDEKGLTTDSGWGCMLRTGQTLLANGLIHHHLGRDWRRPDGPPGADASAQEVLDYATYVRILTWFMDDPLPYAPFSVHRMALIGKQLGKEVGEWFGPSTAAGAIKTLVASYPHAGVSVSVASDSVIIKTDVFAVSHPPLPDELSSSLSKRPAPKPTQWGSRPVIVLVGIRLGLDGVNPIYHDSVRDLLAFPQSLGIAGGRPSSSYYFLGYQGDSLIYLDPHHTRPAVVLNPPPLRDVLLATNTLSPKAALAPSPAIVASAGDPFASPSAAKSSLSPGRTTRRTLPSPARARTPGSSSPSPSLQSRTSPQPTRTDVDPLAEWFNTAYPPSALQSFHCDKVRKMSFGQLDPSMLLGFLCKDEADWNDFRTRVANMPHAIFSISDEASSWDDEAEIGLESFSETDPETSSVADGQSSLRGSPSRLSTGGELGGGDDLGAQRNGPQHSRMSSASLVEAKLSLAPAEPVSSQLTPQQFQGLPSAHSFRPASRPSTERPINPRALGSEFEIVDEDDWRELESDDLEDIDARPGSPVSKNRRSLADHLQASSLAFPTLGKGPENAPSDAGEGSRTFTRARASKGTGSKLRRKAGRRSISGTTARLLEEGDEGPRMDEDDDDDDDWNERL